MNCGDLSELYELYALGALDGEEKQAAEEHLARNCEACMEELSRATETNAMIFRAAPKMDPPAKLRARVLAGFGIDTRPFWMRALPWGIAAAAVAALLLAGIYFRPRDTANRPEASAMDLLASPGTRQIGFGAGSAPFHGSVLVHQVKGIVLVVVNLPKAPAGKMYETWIVPRSGPPRPTGTLTVEPGQSVAVIPGPVDPANIKAVAVSVEPAAANPTAPTEVLFAAPMN